MQRARSKKSTSQSTPAALHEAVKSEQVDVADQAALTVKTNASALLQSIAGSPPQVIQRKRMEALSNVQPAIEVGTPVRQLSAAAVKKQAAPEEADSSTRPDKTVERVTKGDLGDKNTEWMKSVGLALLAGPAVKAKEGPAKDPDPSPEPAATKETSPRLLSFESKPVNYPRLKKMESSLEGLEAAVKVDEANREAERAKRKKQSKEGGLEPDSEQESAISEFTGGIFDKVKVAFRTAVKLKTAYEEYQAVKNDSSDDASKLEASKAAFEFALDSTSQVLTLINGYRSAAGQAQELAMQMAVPGLAIAMSAIGLITRIVTLVRQGKIDLGKSAEESQTDSILSAVAGDAKQEAQIKAVLQSGTFRALIVATADYRQQQRDNPKLFSEYRKSLDSPKLRKRLQQRYPANFARIEQIHKKNAISPADISPEMEKLAALGVSSQMLEAIIEDQALINHLDEIQDKRSTNARIGIFTDLVNLGADIATLSGAGAVVGEAMKAGTAAIAGARAGGNAIKFAARGAGAEDFSSGAESGWFGSSLYDRTNILKNDAAKQERYFYSSRLLVENIADHDKRVVDAGAQPSEEQIVKINNAYGWVENKILGTGSSVSVVKAMANSGKTGNELLKYFIDRMKQR